MTRLEGNGKVIEALNQRNEHGRPCNPEWSTAFELRNIYDILCDISISLAMIADVLNNRDL